MKPTPLVALVVLALASLAAACGAVVGDACENSTDCGQNLVCETSLPDGYCTTRDCDLESCPDDSVCIEFRPDLSFCMASCASNGDCREGYVCVRDFGSHPFCNAVDAPE